MSSSSAAPRSYITAKLIDVRPPGKEPYDYVKYAYHKPDAAPGKRYKNISPSRALYLRNEKGVRIVDAPDPVYKVPGGFREKHKTVSFKRYEDYVTGKAVRADPLVITTSEVKKLSKEHNVPSSVVKGIIRDMDRVGLTEINEYDATTGGRRGEHFRTSYDPDSYAVFSAGVAPRRKPTKKPKKKTKADKEANLAARIALQY